MSKARQNLTRRMNSETDKAKAQRLAARLSPKKRKALGLPAPPNGNGEKKGDGDGRDV